MKRVFKKSDRLKRCINSSTKDLIYSWSIYSNYRKLAVVRKIWKCTWSN